LTVSQKVPIFNERQLTRSKVAQQKRDQAMLSNLQKVALSKAISSKDLKEARASLNPGVYPVAMSIDIAGNVEIKADGTKAATSAIPWSLVALHLLKKSGATQAAMIKQVQAIAELDKDDRDELTRIEKVLKAEIMKDVGKIAVKGRVTAILSLIEK